MDKLAPKRRSANMRAIRGANTRPELAVRKALRQGGFTGYRLHCKDLPGKPDIAFLGRKKAIFVNGCFWHGHDCPEGLRRPRSRQDYWLPKISSNQARDERDIVSLQALGWCVLTVWECESSSPALVSRLASFMAPPN